MVIYDINSQMENFRLFVVLCSVFYVASDAAAAASLLTCLLSFVLAHYSAELCIHHYYEWSVYIYYVIDISCSQCLIPI